MGPREMGWRSWMGSEKPGVEEGGEAEGWGEEFSLEFRPQSEEY